MHLHGRAERRIRLSEALLLAHAAVVAEAFPASLSDAAKACASQQLCMDEARSAELAPARYKQTVDIPYSYHHSIRSTVILYWETDAS